MSGAPACWVRGLQWRCNQQVPSIVGVVPLAHLFTCDQLPEQHACNVWVWVAGRQS